MKKYIIYLTTFLVCLAGTACEDFLDVESRSTMTEKSMFATEADAYRSVLSVYGPLCHGRLYGGRLTYTFPYNSDIEYVKGSSVDPMTEYSVCTYSTHSTNTNALASLEFMYVAINRANECIEGFEKWSAPYAESPDDKPSMIRNMYGEVKAIRALMYLELIRLWGDVPFYTTPTVPEDWSIYRYPTGRNEILAFLVDDLIEAEPFMLPAKEIPEKVERFNRTAMQALIARIALARGGWSLMPNGFSGIEGYIGNPTDNGYDPSGNGVYYRAPDWEEYYEIANLYCRKAIDEAEHDLGGDFKTVFYNQCQEIVPGDGDILWEVPFGYSVQDAGGCIGYFIGVNVPTSPVTNGSNVVLLANPTYIASFEPGDLRRDVTAQPWEWVWDSQEKVLKQGIMSWVMAIPISKWSKMEAKTQQTPGMRSQNTGINYPILRFADVLLMYAETENQLNGGPTSEGIDALKRVRQRAFSPEDWPEMVDSYVNGLGSQDDFFEAIVNERAWEFGGEGIRKYDLIRWNMFDSKMKNVKKEAQLLYDGVTKNIGKYAGRPRHLYSRYLEDGVTLEIIGQDGTPDPIPVGYDATGWFSGVGDYDAVSNEFLPQIYFEYYYPDQIIRDKTPIPYPQPFHRDYVNESNGTLVQYYGNK